jgi:cobalt-zinc-cadmium efflux system protein
MSHDHSHLPEVSKASSALLWAFGINFVFLIVEVIGGLISGSMALLADAGHMLSDVIALGAAVWVSRAMHSPATKFKSFGYGRLEVISGLINGLVLWGIVIWIFVEAIQRFFEPQDVSVEVMLPVAIAGLVANMVSAWILFSQRDSDLNNKQAYLHLMSDAAGSVGAVIAGIALLIGGWMWLDTLVSIIIGLLIFVSSISLVKHAFHILLEGVPPDIDCEVIREVLNQQDEIEEAHDIHAWMIGSNEMMLTAHFVPAIGYSSQSALESAKQAVQEHFGIRHVTFQVESSRCSVSHD